MGPLNLNSNSVLSRDTHWAFAPKLPSLPAATRQIDGTKLSPEMLCHLGEEAYRSSLRYQSWCHTWAQGLSSARYWLSEEKVISPKRTPSEKYLEELFRSNFRITAIKAERISTNMEGADLLKLYTAQANRVAKELVSTMEQFAARNGVLTPSLQLKILIEAAILYPSLPRLSKKIADLCETLLESEPKRVSLKKLLAKAQHHYRQRE